MTKRLPVTAGRLVALLAGVPVALFAIGVAGLTAVAYAGEGTYPVRLDLPVRGQTVRIGIDSGRLNGGAATARLRVTGTARYSLIRSTVTWHASRSGVAVNSRCHFPVAPCTFSYRVALPAGVRPVITASSADITLMGLANAEISVADGSGNVALSFATVPRRIYVSDRFGDVTLILPPGKTAYRVSAHSTFGRTSVSVPTNSASTHVITVNDATSNISIGT